MSDESQSGDAKGETHSGFALSVNRAEQQEIHDVCNRDDEQQCRHGLQPESDSSRGGQLAMFGIAPGEQTPELDVRRGVSDAGFDERITIDSRRLACDL